MLIVKSSDEECVTGERFAKPGTDNDGTIKASKGGGQEWSIIRFLRLQSFGKQYLINKYTILLFSGFSFSACPLANLSVKTDRCFSQ